MAYAHVQTVAGSAQTASVTISITPSNLVVVTGMFTTGGGTTDFTPTTNTSAVFTSAEDTGASATNYQVRSYYLLNAGSGITSVTATFDTGTPGEYGFVVSEYSGIATSSALVGSAAQVQAGPGTGTDAVTSGNTAALSSQPALVYGYAFNSNYSAITQGTGFTSRLTSAFGGNLQVEDKRVTATTAVAGTFTSADGTANFNVVALAFAEATSAVSITPSVGALTLAGLAATVALSGAVTRTPSVGALTLTGNPATVTSSSTHARTPSVGALTLTGLQPIQELTVAAPITGSLTLSGNAATVIRGTIRQPSVGSLTLTGQQASAVLPRTITPSLGSLTLTGLQASVTVGVANTILIPQPGALTINGQAVTLIHSSPLIRPSAGALTLTGNAAGVLATSSRAYVGGTAVTETGVMITDFLDDATPVPSIKVMLGGIAHTQDGLRYVALWPASDVAFYNGGRAIRSDGAMIIATSGTIAAYRAGVAMTYRGETIVSTSQPEVVHNGFGLRETGALCVSEAA